MRYQILIDSCGDMENEQYKTGCLSKIKLEASEGENGIPKTSCPAPADFMEQVEDDVSHLYIVTLSSRLSGTYNSARIAVNLLAEEKENREHRREQKFCVIDSKSASAGEALLVWMIQEMEEEKFPFAEIECAVEKTIVNMKTRFVLQDLQMLEKSGRLTGIKARVADTFHICPIMEGTREGTIAQRGQARGQKKAMIQLLRQIVKDCKEQTPSHMVISHCRCPEKASALKAAVLERFPKLSIRVLETGEISSIYAGEGAVIIAYA